jgi:hypothetical protein
VTARHPSLGFARATARSSRYARRRTRRELSPREGSYAAVDRTPVTPLTRFRLGALSKPMTSIAAAVLHDRGRLDLDAPVLRYVPAYSQKQWTVTTRQLMGDVAGVHRSRGDIIDGDARAAEGGDHYVSPDAHAPRLWSVHDVRARLDGGQRPAGRPARMVSHRGSPSGGTVSLLTFPDLGLAVAAAANMTDVTGVNPFALQVADAFTSSQNCRDTSGK